MRVILLKTIPKLGEAGEVKDVSDGYGRNFLLPQKLAEIATSANLSRIKKLAEHQSQLEVKQEIAVKKATRQLNGLVLEIQEKANSRGKFYAAISKAVIAEKLKAQGFEIDKNQIEMGQASSPLKAAIKEPGQYPVIIRLPSGLKAEITLIAKA